MEAATKAGSVPRTIFVVDDDRGLALLVEKALQREGFATASAGSFQEAVEWLEKHRADLMLLDLKLEDIGGKELIDYLVVNGRPVPFIIITGQGDERVAVAMMKRGAIDYLVKDVDFLSFVPEVVRRALGQLDRDRKLAEAEEALRRSEANLARAQQIAHLGSFEINIPASSEDYHSEEVYRILGIEHAAVRGLAPAVLERMVHPADRSRYAEAIEQAIQGATAFRLECRVLRADGALRHVRLVAEPVLDIQRTVRKLVGTLLDITESKRAELRQQVQYETARVLAEAATLADAAPRLLTAICDILDWDVGELWQVDLKQQSVRCIETRHRSDLQISRFEQSARGCNFSPGAGLPGRTWQHGKALWIPDITRETGFCRLELAREDGIRCAVSLPVLLGTEVLGVAVFFSRDARARDAELLQTFSVLGSQLGQFIERTRAEEALRKEHLFTSTVLDTSSALVVVLDADGKIVRFNRACERTTGYAAAEVRGRPFWEIFLVAEELEEVREVFQRLRSGQSPSQHENYWLARSGERRMIAWSNSALLDNDGTVEYVISIGIDVSERRRLEQEILQISDQEQRRIGQDLHDGLCQHLAGTELMAETLEQKIARKSKADAARVGEIAKHVREAISQTRLLARGLSPVVLESEGLMSALEELASTTVHMFRVACGFHCAAAVLVHDHSKAVHLYRIAQEAISNAIRHGKAKRIAVSLERTGDRIVLQIRDDGAGLPKERAQSKGMGLRIMPYRAAIIGGTLSIENQTGGGTVVTCTLPNPTVTKAPTSYEHRKETEDHQKDRTHRR